MCYITSFDVPQCVSGSVKHSCSSYFCTWLKTVFSHFNYPLEWRPGSTAQTLSDLDLTSQRDGRWKRINTLMHYNVRCFKNVVHTCYLFSCNK